MRWSGDAAAAGVTVDDFEWGVPYLPIDPKDVGRTYEAVIRVNSQSGKGGVAYIMKSEHHLDLPRRLQIEFSGVVQRHTDDEGGEVAPGSRCGTSSPREYLVDTSRPAARGAHVRGLALSTARSSWPPTPPSTAPAAQLAGVGNGPIDAFVHALCDVDSTCGARLRRARADRRRRRPGRRLRRVRVDGETRWGVGVDANIVTASLRAVSAAVNRR